MVFLKIYNDGNFHKIFMRIPDKKSYDAISSFKRIAMRLYYENNYKILDKYKGFTYDFSVNDKLNIRLIYIMRNTWFNLAQFRMPNDKFNKLVMDLMDSFIRIENDFRR